MVLFVHHLTTAHCRGRVVHFSASPEWGLAVWLALVNGPRLEVVVCLSDMV